MDLESSDFAGSMDLQHTLGILKRQQEDMIRSLQRMAENGSQFLEELRGIFASSTGAKSTSSGNIGSFSTASRSIIPQHEHDLLRENQESLTCLHHQPLRHGNHCNREEPDLIISKRQQQDPLPSSLQLPYPDNSDTGASYKVSMDVEEGDFDHIIAVASTTTRMDKDSFEFLRKADVDACAGENDNGVKVDLTPRHTGEVFPLIKVHKQIIPSINSVDEDDKTSHICTPMNFGGSSSEAKVKEAMRIFIIAVRGGVCMVTPECVYWQRFLADIKYWDSLLSDHDYIFKSLEIDVGIMVGNQLLTRYIRHGLTSEAYRLVEEGSHNIFTSWDVIRWLAYEDLGEDTYFEHVRLKPIEDIVSLIPSVYHGFGAVDGTADQMFEERDAGCLRKGSQWTLAATGGSSLILYGKEMTKGKFVGSLSMEEKVYLHYVIDKATIGKEAGVVHKIVLDERESEVVLGRLHMRVKSALCWLQSQDKNDCFYDFVGYFLIQCAEKTFTSQDQRCISQLWITDKPCWTTQFLSEIERRGVHIKLLESAKGEGNNGEKMISLYISYATIPIWIMFFALGVSSNSEVFEMIYPVLRNADEVCEGPRRGVKAREFVNQLIEGAKLPSTEPFEEYIDKFLFPGFTVWRQKAFFIGYMTKWFFLLIQRDLNGSDELHLIERYLESSIITNGLNRAFSTGHWCHPCKRAERTAGKVCWIQLLSSIYASPNQREKALEGHPQEAMAILHQHSNELDFFVVSLPKSNDSSNGNRKRICETVANFKSMCRLPSTQQDMQRWIVVLSTSMIKHRRMTSKTNKANAQILIQWLNGTVAAGVMKSWRPSTHITLTLFLEDKEHLKEGVMIRSEKECGGKVS